MNKELKNCLCGEKPKLGKKQISVGATTKYFYYSCSSKKCQHNIVTFGTRKEEFCRELWNSTIKHKTK